MSRAWRSTDPDQYCVAMELGLATRTVVVTGASKGIGLAIAQAFVDEGSTVIAGARHSSDGLEALVATGRARVVEVDLGSDDGPARLIAEAPNWIYYDVPDDALGIALKGRFRGQRQRWFAFLFEGEESEIDVIEPGDGSMPSEFDAWRWEELSRTPELIVAFKRDAYKQIVAAFGHLPHQIATPEA